jgi:O-antigen/teichoic acid export membrane protein
VAAASTRPVSAARHHKLVSNIFSNWATTVVTAICGFLLAPVMVHRLGDAGYGIWAFGMQLTTYLSVLDFGVRSSVARFLTYHHTRDEKDKINGVVSVALVILGGLAALCVIVSLFVAGFLNRMIKIPPGMLHQSQWTILLVSGMVAVSLPGAVFSGAIASLSRYDLLNLRYTSALAVRAVVTWVVLIKGGGILAIAVVWLAVAVVCSVIDAAIANALYGGFELKLDWQEYRPLARSLFAFSFYAFLLGISSRLVLWSDNVVVAMILGPVAVTFYAIGGNLVDLSRATLNSMTTVLVPLATSYEAKGDSSALKQLLVRGSRMGLLVLLPVVIAFLIVGRDFISLWMGPRYVLVAGTVLVLLSVPVLFAPLQATSNQILFGMNRHQTYACIAIVEAIVNLGLSIVLARKLGVVGVAWGTMVPAVIIEGFIVPLYTARVLKQPAGTLYWQSWIRPVVLSLPYGAWLLLLHRAGWTSSWAGFVATIASGLVVYAITLWLVTLSREEKQLLVRRVKELLPAPMRAATQLGSPSE